MSNLHRRLQKLEARLTDSSGLVPNSQAWRDYWFPKVDQLASGEGPGPGVLIPLEVVHAYIAASTEKPNGE
jgi:hypothetical protein